METAPTGSTLSDSGKPAPRSRRVAGGRRLGLGVLLAFTVKGIFTTAAMVMALAAAKMEEGYGVQQALDQLLFGSENACRITSDLRRLNSSRN